MRSGRRLPHIWLDTAQTESVIDYCGVDYCVLLGPEATDEWRQQIEQMAASKWPLRCVSLTAAQVAGSPLANEAVVIVRPDLIVAARVGVGESLVPERLLEGVLPFAEAG